jgi:hypothetical protein
MEDARPLDELADDPARADVLLNDTLHPRRVHPIIQSRDAAWARQRGKPAAQGRLFGHELANQHIRPLRAPAEAALPHQLRTITSGVRI